MTRTATSIAVVHYLSTLSETEKDQYPLRRFFVRTLIRSGNVKYVIHVCVYVSNQS